MSPVIKGGGLWNPNVPKVTFEEAIDPSNPGEWVMVEDNEMFRRWERELDGGYILQKTECKNTDKLLADNERAYNESEGRRWGNGDVIGSVPLDLYFSSGLAEANKQGDRKFQQKWWDDPDHRKFRKRKGTL